MARRQPQGRISIEGNAEHPYEKEHTMDQSKEPIRTIGSARVAEAAKADVSVIDVRPAAMYEEGHIPGAVNVPLEIGRAHV